MNNVKIRFILLVAVLLLTQTLLANTTPTTYYFNVKATASPTGAGTVYVSANSNDSPNYQNTSSANASVEDVDQKNFYFWAKPVNPEINLIQWHLGTANGTVVGEGEFITYTVKGSTSQSATHANLFATFDQAWVTVVNPYSDYCSVSINPVGNVEGTQVTLSASNFSSGVSFLGWRKQGSNEIISTSNPYSFTVTERAVYEPALSGVTTVREGYYRFVNANSSIDNKVISLEDNLFDMQSIIGSVSSFNNLSDEQKIARAEPQLAKDIKMRTIDEAVTMPNTIVYVKSAGSQYNLIVQGTNMKELSTGSFYGSRAGEVRSDGAYVDLQSVGPNYYLSMTVQGKAMSLLGASATLGPMYFSNENGSLRVSEQKSSSAEGKWILEPIDLDENYFAIQPNEQICLDGKYYTTLRASFPCKIPENSTMKVFGVTGMPTAEEGQATLQVYGPGQTIPAGMPVVIQSTSLLPADNKLLPVGDPSAAISTINPVVNTALYKNYGAHRHDNARLAQYNSSKVDRVPMSGDQVGYFKLNPDYSDYVSNTTEYYELGIKDGVVGFWQKVAQGTYSSKTYPKLDGNVAYSLMQCSLFEHVDAPEITPANGSNYAIGEDVSISITAAAGVTIQYSIDNGVTWLTYNGPFNITLNEAGEYVVLAKAIKGFCESEVASATYTFSEAYEDITLAQLVNKPADDTKYNITDLTCVNIIDNAGLLICKDNNGYASKDVTENGWIDYMQQVSGLTVPHEYDQSNWIALRLPQGESLSSDMILKPLTGVKGHLVNATNLEFQLDVKPQFGSRVEFTPNTYIPASFKGTQESPVTGKTYFFVQPKPMEYAHIEWAVSRGDKFITSPRDIEHGINTAGLSGEFEFNGMYLGDFDLQWDHVYKMDAIIKRFTDNFDHVYVMGNVNGLVFDSRKGVEMYTADGKVYTATVTVSNAQGNNNGFFGFTKELGATWESIAAYRYGADANNKYVTAGTYAVNQNTNSFEILPGTYTLTLDMTKGELTIAAPSANAPRRVDAQAQARYIVYPVTIQQTSESVITGVMNVAGVREVAAVEYVNLAGQRSSRPWQGVNIVVTRYTDGTVTTAKECK